jgi:hypothetical protein
MATKKIKVSAQAKLPDFDICVCGHTKREHKLRDLSLLEDCRIKDCPCPSFEAKR